jgi:hypothetical protein
VAATRSALQGSAQRLGLAPDGDPLNFAIAGLSDRRVLQSLQLVLQGNDLGRPLAARRTRPRRPSHPPPRRDPGDGPQRKGNLILAVEEPEQNLEPISQRLVTRSLLFAERAEARQTLVSTHSSAVAGSMPLANLHLAREFSSGRELKALRDALPAEHKFFELHARSALIAGLYAAAVLLVEGPTERGGLPELWAKHLLDQGLDEHRIEVIDCESVNKMPSFVGSSDPSGSQLSRYATAIGPRPIRISSKQSQTRCCPGTLTSTGRAF